MKKAIISFIITATLLTGVKSTFGQGIGTIPQLQQWVSTTSPSTAVTQQTYGKSVRISGQTTGCAQFDSNGILTSTGGTGCLTVGSTAINSILSTNSSGVITATSTPTFGSFNATSTNATSTIAGHLDITGNLKVSGALFTPISIYSSGTVTAGNFVGTSATASSFAGNVGIGTASPGSKLEVAGKLTVSTTLSGDTVANFINLSSSGYGLRSQGGGGSSGLYLASFNDYAGNEKVRITDAGNVGIGTASPFGKLSVEQTGGNQVVARYNSSNGRGGIYTGGSSGATFIGNNLTHSTGNVFNYDTTGTAWYMGNPAGNTYLSIGVGSGTAGNSAGIDDLSTARVNITTAGNVGIGTASPSQKLQVAGSAVIDSALTVGTSLTLGSGDLIYTNSQTIRANTSDGSDNLRVFLAGGGAVSSSQGGYVFASGNESATPGVVGLVAGDGGSIQLTNGNVGIGNTAPTAPLAIGTAGVNTLPTNTKIWMSGAGSGAGTTIQNRISLGVDHNQDYGAYFGAINLDGSFNQVAQFGTRVNGTDYATLNLNQGFVGIGTTTPIFKLQVTADNSTGGSPQIVISGSTNPNSRLYIGYDTNSNYASLQAITEGTAYRALALNPSGGNVGIGLGSPTARLEVRNSGTADNAIYVTNTVGGAQATLGAWSSNDGAMRLWKADGTESVRLLANGASHLTGGNLGIGTTTPAYQLTTTSGFALNQTTPATNYIGGNLMLNRADSASEFGTSNNFDLHFRTNDTRRMTILSGGNVGIGTSTPLGKLQVSSGASATTTVSFGEIGSSSSKSCFNTKNNTGGDISFYFVGTSMVVENNLCR